jgi:hypothetical protein
MASAFKADYHFSLVVVARCEIQAIDQHWSLHRLAISLPDGESDDALAAELSFHQTSVDPAAKLDWPSLPPSRLRELLQQGMEREAVEELVRIRERQEKSLRHEMERIDAYFENYEGDLTARAQRSSVPSSKAKTADRLAAAKAEHARRRADQVARHEIHVHPHVDALLLVAEKAWRASVQVEQGRQTQTLDALFVPRNRRWVLEPQK